MPSRCVPLLACPAVQRAGMQVTTQIDPHEAASRFVMNEEKSLA
jgi:hypothetical protein